MAESTGITAESSGAQAGDMFAGRLKEMGDLRAALESTLSGDGRLAMLVGEPGIGKTRTAQEFASYAATRDVGVLWGRCSESRGAPPYWPWVQAIRSYARSSGSDVLRSEMGSGASDILGMIPELAEQLP
ncbi:MAG: ATP-binding protein, partial [Dehalococcoidia bacterium]